MLLMYSYLSLLVLHLGVENIVVWIKLSKAKFLFGFIFILYCIYKITVVKIMFLMVRFFINYNFHTISKYNDQII